jgi:hypothetical protein
MTLESRLPAVFRNKFSWSASGSTCRDNHRVSVQINALPVETVNIVPAVERSLSDLGNQSENSAVRDQILPIFKVNSCSVDQGSGEI